MPSRHANSLLNKPPRPLIEAAYEQALKGYREGGLPIGSVLATSTESTIQIELHPNCSLTPFIVMLPL